MAKDRAKLDERIAASDGRLSPVLRQVAHYLASHQEVAVAATAAQLAELVGASNATVVRAIQALGYAGMADFRRQLAVELSKNMSPAARLGRTLDELGRDTHGVLESVLDIHQSALDSLRREISTALFSKAVKRLVNARRIFVFGVGPSGAMADYFVLQLGRFGIDARSLTQTGLLLADGLHQMQTKDCLVILAYSRVYREVEAALDCAQTQGVKCILLTDSLRVALAPRVDLILPVARGRATLFSMHTATLGLIEALLAGLAAQRPGPTLSALESLNDLRVTLVDEKTRLQLSTRQRHPNT